VLQDYLAKVGAPLHKVVQINVPDGVLLERIRSRQEQTGVTRADDNAEVAAKRLKVYWEQTAPVADYYAQAGLLAKIDGVGTVSEVLSRIMAALGS
jgi:adenylate kinase